MVLKERKRQGKNWLKWLKSWSSFEKGRPAFLISIGGFTFVVFKTYKMNDMKGKQGLVCMGLLLVLSSCHTGKQITASGLTAEGFSNRSEWAAYRFIYIEQQAGNGGLYHKLWGTGGFYPCPRQKWKTGGCGVRIFHDY